MNKIYYRRPRGLNTRGPLHLLLLLIRRCSYQTQEGITIPRPDALTAPLYLLLWGGEWHCMTARSCSARAGVKRIYTRMPDSRTKASTCFAAAVLRRISGVEKFIPRISTACFSRRRASVNLVQTSITCSTVSGTSHRSQSPSDQYVTYNDLDDSDRCINERL